MLHKVRFAQFLSFVYKSIRQFLGILATGFFIEKYSQKGICETLEFALSVYNNRTVWTRLVKNAMRQDLSWDKSAKAYLELYSKTIV